MEIKRRQVFNFTLNGRDVFREWLASLKDSKARAVIRLRIDRLLLGNIGDHRKLINGLYELRIHYGPGYRIYCGNINDTFSIIFCGGIKGTQKQDIKKAKKYWQEFKNKNHE